MSTSRKSNKRAAANKAVGKRKAGGDPDPDNEADGPLVIKCKTTFKKRVVERALVKEDERCSEDDSSDNPTVKYFLKYCVKQDLLTVGDVNVIVDETEKCLRCSQCRYANKAKWDKDKKTSANLKSMMDGIRNHVIGQHCGGFRCTQCTDVLTAHKSYSEHQKHVRDVHNEWLKQLNAKIKRAERGVTEEESKAGDSSDGEDIDGKSLPLKFKCSYPNCGKRFHKAARWERHEKEVHGGATKGQEASSSHKKRKEEEEEGTETEGSSRGEKPASVK